MESKALALNVHELADNRKAENLVILDLKDVSSVTDYFVIATGTSEPHIKAIVEEISTRLKHDHGVTPLGSDGGSRSPWVVLDYFDVIVHVMREDIRELYNLEGLWGDTPRITPELKVATADPA